MIRYLQLQKVKVFAEEPRVKIMNQREPIMLSLMQMTAISSAKREMNPQLTTEMGKEILTNLMQMTERTPARTQTILKGIND